MTGPAEPAGKQPGHSEPGAKAVTAALLANLGIAAAKFAGFAITGSSSMLAEAAHSVADMGNQGLLFTGMRRARRARDTAHPFGYGPERYFWAFTVALVLFSLGSLFSLYEGISKLAHPRPIQSVPVAIVILALAMVLEALSLRTAVREASPGRESPSWWRFVRDSKSAELPVVLLEDSAALVGLTFAMAGVTASAVTGDSIYDALGTIAISVLLAFIAGVLAIEMKSLLLGEAATPTQEALIRGAIEAGSGVVRLIHMRTTHLAPDEILLTAKVEFSPELGASNLADAVNSAEARVREALPDVGIIYLEPDVFDPARDGSDS